jgi:agmatinase
MIGRVVKKKHVTMLKPEEETGGNGTPLTVRKPVGVLRLELNRRMAIESKDDSDMVIFNLDTGARYKLSRPLYQLICKFGAPAYVDDVLSGYSAGGRLVKIISELIEKEILVEEGYVSPPKEIKLTASPQTMFNTPRRSEGDYSHVSLVGVPFDLGNTVAAGARRGPHEIRARSRQYDYHFDLLSGRPIGWFDLDLEERILEGVTFSDWGDVWFRYGEDPEKIFRRITDVCEDIVDAGSFPIFLGGDHSITFPIVECLQRRRSLCVIWFDAHNDLGEISPGASHHHGNVARRILDLPNISKVVQVGLRGYTVYNELGLGGEKVTTITASRLRAQGISSILESLPESEAFYISIDIDVLDPVHAPATSTPVPGGISPAELKSALCAIGLHRNVIGLDLVEVNPDRDNNNITASVACQLLLAATGAVMKRRDGGA